MFKHPAHTAPTPFELLGLPPEPSRDGSTTISVPVDGPRLGLRCSLLDLEFMKRNPQ
jgi:hypothetical protein